MDKLRDFKVVRFGFENISPERAKEILLKNECNRNIRQRDVEMYSKFMKKGSWRQDLGEPIHLSVNGRVLNGQHRLNAVVLSGMTIKFMIFYMEPIDGLGELTATGMPIDRGAMRSISDLTGIPPKSSQIVTTMIRDLSKNGHQSVRDPEIILGCYDDLKSNIEYVLQKCNTSSRTFSQSSIKSVIILRNAQGYDFTEEYINILNHKYNLLTNGWNSWIRIIEGYAGRHQQPERREIMCYTWAVTDPMRNHEKKLQIKKMETCFDEIVNTFYGFCMNSLTSKPQKQKIA
jgi:hypothetical protein